MVTTFSRCFRFSVVRMFFVLMGISFAALSSHAFEIAWRSDSRVTPLDSQLWLKEFGAGFGGNLSATVESAATDSPSGLADKQDSASAGKKKQKHIGANSAAAAETERDAEEKLSVKAAQATVMPETVDPLTRIEGQLLVPSVTLTSAAMSGGDAESTAESSSSGVSPSDWDVSAANSARRADQSTVKGPSLTTYLVGIAALIVVCGAFLTPKY